MEKLLQQQEDKKMPLVELSQDLFETSATSIKPALKESNSEKKCKIHYSNGPSVGFLYYVLHINQSTIAVVSCPNIQILLIYQE